MDRSGLAAGAIALAIAGLLAAAPGAERPARAAPAPPAALGPGAPEALLAFRSPALRFSVPAGGHASLRVGFGADEGVGRAPAEPALVALLGVPGVWPLGAARGLAGASAPALEAAAAPVPEPGSLTLLALGAGGLAPARTLRARRPAGRGSVRLSP